MLEHHLRLHQTRRRWGLSALQRHAAQPRPNHAHGSLEFTFKRHRDVVCFCVSPSPLIDGVTPSLAKSVMTGSSTTHQPALTQGVHTIFQTIDIRRAQKFTHKIVYATTTTTHKKYMEWYDSAATFNCFNHSDCIPHAGKFALVLESLVGVCRLPKVLMDGDSRINIIFSNTLTKMGISKSRLLKEIFPKGNNKVVILYFLIS